MDIYYSNAQSEKWDGENIKPFPMLVAFSDINKKKEFIRQKKCNKLMLDSGAFSVWNSGKEIKLSDYINFLHEHSSLFDVRINLDVIGNNKESYKNFKTILKEGLNVIPVYQILEGNLEYLFKYAEISNYIGIGGIAKMKAKERLLGLRKIFENFPDPKKIGFHGFGVAEIQTMLAFPWRSVDARTAHIAARFGLVCTPWGNIRLNTNIPKDGPKALAWRGKSEIKKKIYKYLNEMEVDIKRASQQNVSGKIERTRASIMYFEKCIKPKVPKYYSTKINYLF